MDTCVATTWRQLCDAYTRESNKLPLYVVSVAIFTLAIACCMTGAAAIGRSPIDPTLHWVIYTLIFVWPLLGFTCAWMLHCRDQVQQVWQKASLEIHETL
jgi:hypothetical protein